jgi:hypothetical protein
VTGFTAMGRRCINKEKNYLRPYIRYGFPCTDFHKTHILLSITAWTQFIMNCTQTGKQKLRGKCHLWTSIKDQHHRADFLRSHVCWTKFHENLVNRSAADSTSSTVGQPDEGDCYKKCSVLINKIHLL